MAKEANHSFKTKFDVEASGGIKQLQQLAKAYDRQEKELIKVQGQMAKYEKMSKKGAAATSGLSQKLGGLVNGYTVAAAAVIGAVMAIDRMAESTIRTSNIMGHAKINVDGAADAVDHMTTKLELQANANKLTSAGIDITNEQYTKMAGAIARAADAAGKDLVTGLNAATDSLARGSVEGLANIGIRLDMVKIYEAHAHSIGKEVKELNLHEKQQASVNAMMEESDKIMSRNATSVDNVAFSWVRAKNQMKDTAAEATVAVAGWLTDLADEWGNIANETNRAIQAMADYAEKHENVNPDDFKPVNYLKRDEFATVSTRAAPMLPGQQEEIDLQKKQMEAVTQAAAKTRTGLIQSIALREKEIGLLEASEGKQRELKKILTEQFAEQSRLAKLKIESAANDEERSRFQEEHMKNEVAHAKQMSGINKQLASEAKARQDKRIDYQLAIHESELAGFQRQMENTKQVHQAIDDVFNQQIKIARFKLANAETDAERIRTQTEIQNLQHQQDMAHAKEKENALKRQADETAKAIENQAKFIESERAYGMEKEQIRLNELMREREAIDAGLVSGDPMLAREDEIAAKLEMITLERSLSNDRIEIMRLEDEYSDIVHQRELMRFEQKRNEALATQAIILDGTQAFTDSVMAGVNSVVMAEKWSGKAFFGMVKNALKAQALQAAGIGIGKLVEAIALSSTPWTAALAPPVYAASAFAFAKAGVLGSMALGAHAVTSNMGGGAGAAARTGPSGASAGTMPGMPAARPTERDRPMDRPDMPQSSETPQQASRAPQISITVNGVMGDKEETGRYLMGAITTAMATDDSGTKKFSRELDRHR